MQIHLKEKLCIIIHTWNSSDCGVCSKHALPSPASVQSTVKCVGSWAFRPVLSIPGPNTFTLCGWLPFPTFTYRNKVSWMLISASNVTREWENKQQKKHTHTAKSLHCTFRERKKIIQIKSFDAFSGHKVALTNN